VGFCMLITRRALEMVGPFDGEAFGAGYGEENDFCQRAIAAGFVNLIADHTFVYHRGRGSFGEAGDHLTTKNLALVVSRHPRYHADVGAFIAAHPLRGFHDWLASRVATPGAQAVPMRVLHVMHHGGGTEMHARDLAGMPASDIVSYLLRSDGLSLHVEEFHRGRLLRSLVFPLNGDVRSRRPRSNPAYREAFASVCWALRIDLIHVHHLIDNTVDIAGVAAAAAIPYVMTLHDYHTVCPSYTLLDADGGDCGACLQSPHTRPSPRCIAAGHDVSAHQAEMYQFLRHAARLFVPNVRARDIIAHRYPAILPTLAVVEHGSRHAVSEGSPHVPAARSHAAHRGLNVAVIGGLEPHKGSKVLRAVLQANRSNDTTFHLYGTTTERELQTSPGRMLDVDGSKFINHGGYDAREIVGMLRADGIDVGLLPSVWPETFSFTLSEFVEAGIPVIAARSGAQGERIERCQLGWTVPDIRVPEATLAILQDLLESPDKLQAAVAAMRRDEALIPLPTMWRQYVEIYREQTLARTMNRPNAPENDVPPARAYMTFLAGKLASSSPSPAAQQTIAELRAEVERLRELLRSPRHRVADALAGALHRIPVLWPIVARITDSVLKPRQRGA
jgi:glycosyltransferase involved in cell wall biosynthesis